ncbi:C2 domain [Trinorchestia longiramus]|nr:C2 domain [Trinorchestia longiramus]
MKVLGGKEIPGSKGRVCGFVSKILPSGVVDKLREVHEGDLILEWNGIPLMDRTDAEVQRILDQSAQEPEVEILIRNDVNMITGKRLPDAHGKVPDLSTFRDQDWYSPGKGDMYYREFPPRDQRLGYDINGNRYSQNVVTYQPTSRDPFGQYSNLKSADPMDRQLSMVAYDKTQGQLRDSFYNVAASNKNYNHNQNYGNNWTESRYDCSGRDRRYGDDLLNQTSPFIRHRNHNNNKNDLSWRDPYQDRRHRRDTDRYCTGDRELPSTPNMIRRHSWDAHDESGYSRGQYWRSRNSYLDDDYYKTTEGDFLRSKHHSDPAFKTDYHCVRRWHSTERYPDEYKTRHLPEIKLSRYASDDPRERRYGSAQYLDHTSRRYREEFDYARKDLDRFQRFGSFKDYGHHYHDDRHKDRYGSDYYSKGKSYSDDLRYSYDKYHEPKDPYLLSDRYRDTRTNTERYRDEERLRTQQKQSLNRWKDQRDLYDSSRYQETLNPLYMDERTRDYRDNYDARGRDCADRYHDDRYYDYRSPAAYDPYRDTDQSVYTSAQYRDERAYQDSKYRDSRYGGYGELESTERDRKHRSRNPPQQLNLEGRTGPASPSTGRSRDRKHKNNCKEGKSRRSGKSRHHQSHQPQQAEVQLLICHDVVAQILYVTVLRARNLLTLREDGDTRPDPFIKVYLLPGRSLENQRRTRHFQRTSSPEWNQTMVYPNLHQSDLKKRYLEVTAWNYDQHRPNEFLGEVVLDLSGEFQERYAGSEL